MAISLRDVTPGDEAFLREVYASTRAHELALVPWSDEQREAFLRFQFDAQDSYYHAQFPKASYQIVLKDEVPVGRIYVHTRDGETKLLDITILPQFRSAGIGTALIHELLDEARRTNNVVTIWVEHFNPSQNLFRRLGFSAVHKDGYNQLLEFRPLAQNHATVM